MATYDPSPIIENIKEDQRRLNAIRTDLMTVIESRPRANNDQLVAAVKLIDSELVDLEVKTIQVKSGPSYAQQRGAPNYLMDDVSLRKTQS